MSIGLGRGKIWLVKADLFYVLLTRLGATFLCGKQAVITAEH